MVKSCRHRLSNAQVGELRARTEHVREVLKKHKFKVYFSGAVAFGQSLKLSWGENRDDDTLKHMTEQVEELRDIFSGYDYAVRPKILKTRDTYQNPKYTLVLRVSAL